MRASGRQFLVEALFLVVVALVAGFAGLPWPAIVLVMFLAFVLVAVFEVAMSRPRRREEEEARPLAEPLLPALPDARHVHVLPHEPEPAAQPVIERRVEQVPEPEPEPPPAPEPIGPVADPTSAEPPPLPDDEPEPEAEAEPDAEPEAVRLEVVPEPEPEPEPEPAAEPEPPRVVALPLPEAPREWNVWELDRLARASGSEDDERSFLLVYLRDFASPEGTLPVDFDPLIRESFGELLTAR